MTVEVTTLRGFFCGLRLSSAERFIGENKSVSCASLVVGKTASQVHITKIHRPIKGQHNRRRCRAYMLDSEVSHDQVTLANDHDRGIGRA